MKKNTPTLFITIPNFFLLLNPVFLLAIVFYSTSILAQGSGTNDNSSTILELKTFLANQKKGNQNDSSVDDLVHKLQPSVYFYEGTVKTYGENPSNLFTDISSLNRLKDSDMPKNHIKIVRISINNSTDLNSTIDLSIFSNFNNLKYIYIFSSIPISEQNLNAMVVNNDKKYSVFYKIDKGESNQ